MNEQSATPPPSPQSGPAALAKLKPKKKLYIIVLVVWGISVVLSLAAPVDAEALAEYDLSVTQAKLLGLTFSVPILVMWLLLTYGFIRTKHYADLIKESPDGRAFAKIAQGLGILLLSAIVSSYLNTYYSYIRDADGAIMAMTILRNYVSVAFFLVAMWVVYQGSRILLTVGSDQARVKRMRRIGLAVVVLAAIFYLVLIFQNPHRTMSADEDIRATYFLNDWLIVLTIALPTILSWMYGIGAAVHFAEYAKAAPGTLYRAALKKFTWGMLAVVILSVIVQGLGQMSEAFASLGLGGILVVVYILLAIILIGYLLIALGAKKLAKLESV